MARYLITSELGPQRHMTPEGFLICTAVPIARTGEYEYYASEGMSPGIEPDASGRIISRREAAEVFSPAALASFIDINADQEPTLDADDITVVIQS